METLARLSGDPEALVAVMSRNLSHAYNYLRIAETYHENGQHDKALEWAEQGLKAFPERTDRRLREFAAEEYHRRRRHDDAMNLMWAAYVGHPGLERYRTLEQHAKKAGNWKEWRERALLEIRNRIESAGRENRKKNRLRWMQSDDDHSPLVEIFPVRARGRSCVARSSGGGGARPRSGSGWRKNGKATIQRTRFPSTFSRLKCP